MRKNKWKKQRDFGLTMLSLPTLLWYLAFCYLPMFGIVIAFKQYRMIPGKGFIYSLFSGSKWVGFENFRFLFINPQLSMVVRNTLLYNVLFLIIDTVFPVALAVLLSLLYSKKRQGLFQTVSMLPHFMSWVIVSYFLFAFLSADKGLLNNILTTLGLDAAKWYQEPAAWPFILVITHTWKAYGYSVVMYSAYLTAINPVLYDAALIDGATIKERIFYITLPQLKPVIIVLLVMNLGHILNSDFGLFYQVTRNSGSILSATETIDVYTYKALMEQANYGYSAAASLLQNVIGALLLLFADYVIKRFDKDEGIL
jgi:ABC-type polysaccharide transport system, permease component